MSQPPLTSNASVSLEIRSVEDSGLDPRRVILQQIPLTDAGAALELIDCAVRRKASLTLTISSSCLGEIEAPKNIIVRSLGEDSLKRGSGKKHFSGVTYAVGKGAHEVEFEFDMAGNGSVRIIPIDGDWL